MDDPDVEQAMRVYDDALIEAERREVFRSVYRHFLAWQRTRSRSHLTGCASSVIGMVVHETHQPGLHERMRNAPRTIEAAGSVLPGRALDDVIRDLREGAKK